MGGWKGRGSVGGRDGGPSYCTLFPPSHSLLTLPPYLPTGPVTYLSSLIRLASSRDRRICITFSPVYPAPQFSARARSFPERGRVNSKQETSISGPIPCSASPNSLGMRQAFGWQVSFYGAHIKSSSANIHQHGAPCGKPNSKS